MNLAATPTLNSSGDRKEQRVRFVPYHPCHLQMLELQAAQRVDWLEALIARPGYAQLLAAGGMTLSGFGPNLTLLGIAGFLPLEPPRARAWALLSKHVRARDFLEITPLVERQLQLALERWDRIEVQVPPGFARGIRWALRLGFTEEQLLLNYWPGRRSAIQFVALAPPPVAHLDNQPVEVLAA